MAITVYIAALQGKKYFNFNFFSVVVKREKLCAEIEVNFKGS